MSIAARSSDWRDLDRGRPPLIASTSVMGIQSGRCYAWSTFADAILDRIVHNVYRVELSGGVQGRTFSRHRIRLAGRNSAVPTICGFGASRSVDVMAIIG
jgi:hypothetical protein